jgi:hypothetical protein
MFLFMTENALPDHAAKVTCEVKVILLCDSMFFKKILTPTNIITLFYEFAYS